MQAYSQPLLQLQVEASRFLRDRALRLLHVVTDAHLHQAAVELLVGQENRLDNRSPFVVLEQPHAEADPGWTHRAHTVRQQHERRREGMAEHGESLAALPDPPTSQGLMAFAEQLGQLLVARPEGTEGLVVLLAPAYVLAPVSWQQAIGVLLSIGGLATVRWMVVDREQSTIAGLVAHQAKHARATACRLEGESPKAVLADALTDDLLRCSGPLGARPRGVRPPPRPGDPPNLPPDPEGASRLLMSRSVLLAGAAMEQGRLPDAIAHQRRARDLSLESPDPEAAERSVMMELVLGGYLLAAQAPEKAEQSYQRATAMAEEAALPDKVAMAQLAVGSTRLTIHDRPGALVAYARASTTAEETGHTTLAIQACLLTGNLARELGMEAQAIAFWAKAVQLAEQDPATAGLTGAGLAALDLARLCQARGKPEQAAMFLAKAEALGGIDPEDLQSESTETSSSLAIGESASVLEPAPAPEPTPASEPAPVPKPAPVPEPMPTPESPAPIPEPPPISEPGYVPRPEETAPAAILIDSTEPVPWDALVALHGWSQTPASPSADPSSPEHVHHWSACEQDTLRTTTRAILDQDTTELLSHDELRALRGEIDLPPARDEPPPEQTLRLDPEQLARIRHGSSAQLMPTQSGPAEHTEVLLHSELPTPSSAGGTDGSEGTEH